MRTQAPKTDESATVTRRLADQLMDGQLDGFVKSRRTTGMSWRRIALDIRDEIGLDLTDRTLINWFRHETWSGTA